MKNTTGWKIDGNIELERIAEESNWHLGTTVSKLQVAGLSLADAEAFAAFMFASHAKVRDAAPEEYVTDEQWERLSL